MAGHFLVIATKNKGKSAEIKEFLRGFPIEIKDLNDFEPIPDVVEDGATFSENAYKKAAFTATALGLPALADDSGLEVDALGGVPGIHSARYSGPDANDARNNAKLLAELARNPNRKARFCCFISLALPSGLALTYQGHCEGLILDSPRGSMGFGYDPLFYFPPEGKTFAEMSLQEKSRVSHRGQALSELRKDFGNVLSWLDREFDAQ